MISHLHYINSLFIAACFKHRQCMQHIDCSIKVSIEPGILIIIKIPDRTSNIRIIRELYHEG